MLTAIPRRALMLGAILAAVQPLSALAQPGYPTRPIEIVVPVPPGGVNDLPARLIAEKLRQRYGQSVLVVNKPGAGGTIGAQHVVKSKPDGYTLLLAGTGLVFNEALGGVPFSFPKDMAVVAKIADFPSVVTINATIPTRTVDEFAKWARANADKANYGSAGVGSGGHIFGAAFAMQTGTKMVHVPFTGAPAAVNSMLAGDLSMTVAPLGVAKPFIESGKLRALAVTSERRLADLPSVPTMAEAGYPKFVGSQWFGVFAPVGVPDPILAKLTKDITEVVNEPDVKEQLARAGVIAATQNPQAFRKDLESSITYWASLMAQAGIKKE